MNTCEVFSRGPWPRVTLDGGYYCGGGGGVGDRLQGAAPVSGSVRLGQTGLGRM